MSPKPFTPPTHADIAAYAREIRAPATFEPQGFLDYWEARGWLMRPGIRMASWRAAVRTFLRNQRAWAAAGGVAARTSDHAREAAIRDYAAQARLLIRFEEYGQLADLLSKVRDTLGPEAASQVRCQSQSTKQARAIASHPEQNAGAVPRRGSDVGTSPLLGISSEDK